MADPEGFGVYPPKIVVHTDVFLEHLCTVRVSSLLRQAMAKFFCYTTVFQAIELFSFARTETEWRAIEDSMAAVKILGLNPRNARKYGELLADRGRPDLMTVLIAGLCRESRLPLLTDRRNEFRGIPGLLVVPTQFIERYETGTQVLHAARGGSS